MKTRILSCILLLTLIISVLASCAGDPPKGEQTTASTPTAEAPTTEKQNPPDDPDKPTHSIDFVKDGIASLRIMSFNIQESLDDPRALERVQAVRREILSYSPDLLGLQEDSNLWTSLIALPGYTPIGSDSSGGTEEFCGIYVKDGLEIIDCGSSVLNDSHTASGNHCLTVADITDPASPYYLGAESLEALGITASSPETVFTDKRTTYPKPDGTTATAKDDFVLRSKYRRMTYVVLNVNGQAVIYVNTHLQHSSNSIDYVTQSTPAFSMAIKKMKSFQRIKQFDLIMEIVNELKKTYPDANLILTGDLNETEKEQSFPTVYYYFQEAYGLKDSMMIADELGGIQDTWNNQFNIGKYENGYYSGSEVITDARFDYCVVDSTITVKKHIVGEGYVEMPVEGSDTTERIYTSDHRSVVVDLQFAASGKDPDALKPTDFDTGMPPFTTDIIWYKGDPADGETAEYVLENESQLLGFMYLRSLKWNGAQRYTFKGVTLKLARDMVLNDHASIEELKAGGNFVNWIQLNSNYLFLGTFDGQGHSISGVYMIGTNSGVKGMFGGLGDGAVIKNLTVTESYFRMATTADKKTFGVLAAKIKSGSTVTFENIAILDSLIEEASGIGFDRVGGMIGAVEDNVTLTMTNCEFAATIKLEKSAYAGGLIAYANGSNSKISLTACKFTGSLQATDYVGGLVAYAKVKELNIADCVTSSGTITCSGSHKGTEYGYRS